MKSSAKKILSVILGINGFFSINLLSETATLSDTEEAAIQEMTQALKSTTIPVAEKAIILSDTEEAAIQEMTQALKSATVPVAEKAMVELLGANVRADSKEPEKFQSKVKLEVNAVKFDTSRLIWAMKKWEQIKITLRANTDDKSIKWTDNCSVELFIGYNGCRTDGKMLLFRAKCTCVTLPIHTDQSVIFFIPGDIRQRYSLNNTPDYCAIRLMTDGIRQSIVIINKEGKSTFQSDSDAHHKAIEEQAYTEYGILRNIDQLPVYADIKITTHPTLRLEVDA